MIFFSTPSRGQQVLTPLGSEQTTSLLVVMIIVLHTTIHIALIEMKNKDMQ